MIVIKDGDERRLLEAMKGKDWMDVYNVMACMGWKDTVTTKKVLNGMAKRRVLGKKQERVTNRQGKVVEMTYWRYTP